MLTLEEAQAILAAVGSDSAPTVEQLRAARAVFLETAKTAKTQGDKAALATMLETLKAADLAITEAEKLATEAAAEIDALAAEFPELSDEPAAEPSDDAPAAKEPAQVLSVQEAIARLGLAPQKREEQAVVTERPTQTLTIGDREMNDATWGDMGAAFAKALKTNRREGRNTIATFRSEYEHSVKGLGDAAATRVLDSLSDRASEEAVVAAGGCCSLAEPIRDQPMLSSIDRPIASSMPTVGTAAGAVTFFPPVCLPQGGIGTWTCEQDALVDPADDATWKTCETIECVDPDVYNVEAIYKCLTIGNFQQKFNPERWNAILAATAAAQARLAEQTLFNQIANSEYTTQHTVADTGSVYATFIRATLLAAATIRQNQRYAGRRLKVIAPEWISDAAQVDLLMRAVRRGRQVEAEAIETVLARENIDVTWSPDIDPIEPAGQVNGPLTNFPATANIVIYVDGGVFRLDGGEINLGTEIRDHDLNRQNALAAFSESFERGVVRACDTKHITIPVTVCDQAPCLDVEPAPAG